MEKGTKIYHLTLYRFGDTLEIITTNKQKGIATIMKKYEELYRSYNDNENPHRAKNAYDQTYYSAAKEEIEIAEYELDVIQYRGTNYR